MSEHDQDKPARLTTRQLQDELTETRKEVARLRAELERGLRFAHVLAANNQVVARDNAATLNGLGDTLARAGQVDPNAVIQARDRYNAASPAPRYRVRAGLQIDKYSPEAAPVVIDCEARRPLCRSACCRLGYVLSVQDLEEGDVRWDYGDPYVIKRTPSGWCCHLQESRECGVFARRPLSCRRYDCRGNADIWIDFERRIPNPQVKDLPPIHEEG